MAVVAGDEKESADPNVFGWFSSRSTYHTFSWMRVQHSWHVVDVDEIQTKYKGNDAEDNGDDDGDECDAGDDCTKRIQVKWMSHRHVFLAQLSFIPIWFSYLEVFDAAQMFQSPLGRWVSLANRSIKNRDFMGFIGVYAGLI